MGADQPPSDSSSGPDIAPYSHAAAWPASICSGFLFRPQRVTHAIAFQVLIYVSQDTTPFSNVNLTE